MRRGGLMAAVVVTLASAAWGGAQPGGAGLSLDELAGAWSGAVAHDGRSTSLALELTPGEDGMVSVRLTIPAMHLWSAPLGAVLPAVEGDTVHLGAFTVALDRAAGALHGTVPASLAPRYQLPFTLQRVDAIARPLRPDPGGRAVEPVWSFAAGSAMWPGVRLAGGLVIAGGDDGRLHALDARSGRERWSFQAGGAIRSRPTAAGGRVLFQADDGLLYALDRRSGRLRYRVRVVAEAVTRLPFSDPASRYDRYGSDVVAARGRLYLGTHDGRVLCLRARDGATLWEAATGDSVLAAPTLAGGRLLVGSYDGGVYAFDAASGRRLWRYDTGAPVVSIPAVSGGVVVVGSRTYDLLGLDVATGAKVWTEYLWFSWVESSATVRGGTAYVGSSDAAVVLAVDAATGRRRWTTDVHGWAWGQPAVTGERVYVGTAGAADYPVAHRGQAVALDRASGELVWRYTVPPSAAGTFGFTGSPAVGHGLVYFAGLDGRVVALAE